MKKDLILVMPVYNESLIVAKTLDEWSVMLNGLNIDYEMHIYNDGSTDDTLDIIKEFAKKNEKIKVHNKVNSGHGPTILQGYKQNVANSAWLFQTDSDGEMGASFFPKIWDSREGIDFVIAKRAERIQNLSRKFVSYISRVTIYFLYGKGVQDVNCPYRLMKSSVFLDIFDVLAEDCKVPNIIIAGYVNKKGISFKQLPIPHIPRTTGEVSIKKWKLFKFAIHSFWQVLKSHSLICK